MEALAQPQDWEQRIAHNAMVPPKGACASYNPFVEPRGLGVKGKDSSGKRARQVSTDNGERIQACWRGDWEQLRRAAHRAEACLPSKGSGSSLALVWTLRPSLFLA